jgi:hypothetical protein
MVLRMEKIAAATAFEDFLQAANRLFHHNLMHSPEGSKMAPCHANCTKSQRFQRQIRENC